VTLSTLTPPLTACFLTSGAPSTFSYFLYPSSDQGLSSAFLRLSSGTFYFFLNNSAMVSKELGTISSIGILKVPNVG